MKMRFFYKNEKINCKINAKSKEIIRIDHENVDLSQENACLREKIKTIKKTLNFMRTPPKPKKSKPKSHLTSLISVDFKYIPEDKLKNNLEDSVEIPLEDFKEVISDIKRSFQAQESSLTRFQSAISEVKAEFVDLKQLLNDLENEKHTVNELLTNFTDKNDKWYIEDASSLFGESLKSSVQDIGIYQTEKIGIKFQHKTAQMLPKQSLYTQLISIKPKSRSFKDQVLLRSHLFLFHM